MGYSEEQEEGTHAEFHAHVKTHGYTANTINLVDIKGQKEHVCLCCS